MIYKYFKCPECGAVSTAGEWNSTTLALCKNRDQRRAYKKIQLAGNSKRWYKCPKCGIQPYITEILPLQETDIQA